MSKRLIQHLLLNILVKGIPATCLATLGVGAIVSVYNKSLIAEDDLIARRNSELMKELTLTEIEIPTIVEVKEEVIEEEVPEIEEVIEEEPTEIYSAEYLDAGYEFNTDWSSFNQTSLLGINKLSADEMFELYPEIVGGIEVPGTTIKNLITRPQNGERDYYIHTDLNGGYFGDGIVYEDIKYASIAEPTYNMGNIITLYGHNNSYYLDKGQPTKLQFHDFQNYLLNRDQYKRLFVDNIESDENLTDIEPIENKYAEEHSEMYLHYKDGTIGVGKLYAVVRFKKDETGPLFTNPPMETKEQYESYLEKIKAMSEYTANFEPSYENGDIIVVCQTCSHVGQKDNNTLEICVFVLPRVKQITCDEQRYLLNENSNNINNDSQVKCLTR